MANKVFICTPTLNRYDALARMIESAELGTLVPEGYFVIDNGGRFLSHNPKITVISTGKNIGVAASWNWFLKNVEGIKIICNDDIEFTRDAVQKLVEAYNPKAMISPENILGSNSFSCYILGEDVVKTVGYFDEEISPNYAYFEDNDYYRRMSLLGFQLLPVACHVGHIGSATIQQMSHMEREVHNKKFELAKRNYIAKWGGGPGQEKYAEPYKGKRG